jgi:hypothetical protein
LYPRIYKIEAEATSLEELILERRILEEKIIEIKDRKIIKEKKYLRTSSYVTLIGLRRVNSNLIPEGIRYA